MNACSPLAPFVRLAVYGENGERVRTSQGCEMAGR